ncbi:MAG: HD domain-containing protein [Desulfobacteraceae bacterium]|nr:HD domain-containing protein [Desulfobacteraceae bacterium]
MDLKRDHTLRVCENIMDIGRSLNLCENELRIAGTAALLHDIGRFEQYRQYGTFSDYQSEDHAALGVTVIQNEGILSGFDPETAGLITRVVRYHNRAALPAEEDERCLFFLKMVRDADKMDIWRVMTEYYITGGNTRNPAIGLNLPDTPHISDKIHENLCRGRLAQMSNLKTLNDLKLLQMGWVYDLNFRRTFELVREKGYLEMLRNTLPPQSRRAADIYSKARAYLEQNAR